MAIHKGVGVECPVCNLEIQNVDAFPYTTYDGVPMYGVVLFECTACYSKMRIEVARGREFEMETLDEGVGLIVTKDGTPVLHEYGVDDAIIDSQDLPGMESGKNKGG